MRLLNPRQKTAIIQHLDALETLINHVAGQERLREKHEQARQQAIARMRRKRKRSVWVKLWLQRRSLHGQYEQLMKELHTDDVSAFTNFMRMAPQAFHELLTRIAPRITKQDTNYRKALEPGLKLAITLRFLATGDRHCNMVFELPTTAFVCLSRKCARP